MLSYNQIIDALLDDADTEPVTLQEAKDFMRVTHNDDDDTIEELITSSRQMCEAYTNVSFVQRQVEATIDNRNGNTYLPYGPIGEVDEVVDERGVEITNFTLVGTSFKRIKEPQEILTIIYEGGYTTLPLVLKTALLNAIYYLYDNRAAGDIGPQAKQILNQYRRV